MSRSKRNFRLILSAIVLLPVVFSQTIYPLIPIQFWEESSELFYPIFSKGRTHPVGLSPVTIVEVDLETEKRYGWPMPRDKYIELLSNLSVHGKPWLLSFLNFQETADSDKDKALASAIANYGKYVGSGLVVWNEGREEISTYGEEVILPHSIVSSVKQDPEDMPDFGLTFDTAEIFLKGEASSGMAPRYGTLSMILCSRLYFQSQADGVSYAIPTSLLWATSHFLKKDFLTSQGIRSSLGLFDPMSIGSKHCFLSPNTSTREYFAKRQIEIVPFYKVIESPQDLKLNGRLLILANSRMRSFQGPGAVPGVPQSGVVPEHYLSARFLDNIVSGEYITRESLNSSLESKLTIGSVLLLLFLVASARGLAHLILACGGILAGMIAFSLYSFWLQNTYYIPISQFFQLFSSIILFSLYGAYLRFQGFRKIVRFREEMKMSLIEHQDFDSLRQGIIDFFHKEMYGATPEIKTFCSLLYNAVKSPEAVAEYLNTHHDEKDSIKDTALFEVNSSKRTSFFAGSESRNVAFNIVFDDRAIGECRVTAKFEAWEGWVAMPIIKQLKNEISEQWIRVHEETERKISDYQTLVSNARSQIMEKFLSQSIVDKFQDGRTMEENLAQVLTPRETNAAVLQADIRGYSTLFKDQDSISIVKMLQAYYGGTVDVAQQVAQIKLIGDCIFLFIEDDSTSKNSAADLALYLASVLVQHTAEENERQKPSGRDPVVFGIAIHYGDVIMGNLSSDECIDYTVVGPNVNRTARMEELTKSAEVKSVLGPNGIILSKEADKALKSLKNMVIPKHLDLAKIGIKIRSFEEVDAVSYLTADDVKDLSSMMLIDHRKAG